MKMAVEKATLSSCRQRIAMEANNECSTDFRRAPDWQFGSNFEEAGKTFEDAITQASVMVDVVRPRLPPQP